MGMKSKFKNYFFADEEEQYDEEVSNHYDEELPSTKGNQTRSKQNIVSLQSVQQSSKMLLVEPSSLRRSPRYRGSIKKSQIGCCQSSKNSA